MKQLGLLVFVLATVACAPPPPALTLKVDTAGATPVAVLASQAADNSLPEFSLRLFPKYQSAKLISLGNSPEQTEPGVFKIRLPVLPPGQYRLVVETSAARHVFGMPLGSVTQQKIHDFLIHAELPRSCFVFDSAAKDTMGWKAGRVYLDQQTEPVSNDTCPGLFHVNISWPHGLKEASTGGSLFVPVSSECFPRTALTPGENTLWRFSIISPDLTDMPAWQTIKTLQFKMASKSIPVFVTPEIEYQLDKRIQSTRTGLALQTKYQINSGRWSSLQYPVSLPEKARVLRVLFHVYGQPEKTVTDKVDSIFIDAICPVK